MKKKKIKYDVAKNGEEAVSKWRSGGFHLILASASPLARRRAGADGGGADGHPDAGHGRDPGDEGNPEAGEDAYSTVIIMTEQQIITCTILSILYASYITN